MPVLQPTITDWKNCYEGGWKDAIVPEAFAHPAKFSRSLIVRIIQHGLNEGYWAPGSLIGDPFGGVALGGIIAGYHGLNWIGVELEPRFVELGNQNLAMHGPRWLALGEEKHRHREKPSSFGMSATRRVQSAASHSVAQAGH